MGLRDEPWFRMLMRIFAHRRSRGLLLANIANFQRFFFAFVAFGLIVWITGSTALAQGEAVPLDGATVRNFIVSYDAVRESANELSAQYDQSEDSSVIGGWHGWKGEGGARNALDATVEAHGFADFSAWVEALSAIARSYAFVTEFEEADIQISEAQKRVQNNPDISEADREMMLQQLEHTAKTIALMRPSQENIDAVKPHLAELAGFFEENGQEK
jgi:hypothetical protein